MMDLFVQKQQENEEIKFSSKGEMARYIVDKMHNQVRDEMTEENKAKMRAKIEQKLKAGKKLTGKEEQYLKQIDPQMYIQYMRIQARAEAVEEQLRHAKTKQQVNNIITAATASVSDNDPYKEYVLAAIRKVAEDFKSSRAYQKLPASGEERKTDKNFDFETEEEESNEEFDPMAWSPLQEVIDAMPTFDVPA